MGALDDIGFPKVAQRQLEIPARRFLIDVGEKVVGESDAAAVDDRDGALPNRVREPFWGSRYGSKQWGPAATSATDEQWEPRNDFIRRRWQIFRKSLQIGIGATGVYPVVPLPHHPACGSAPGGSES